MATRVWLHEGHDGDPGVEAISFDPLGFSTWAESEVELLARLPAKLAEHAAWRTRHELPIASPQPERFEIAGRLAGNEILFPPDREAATLEEIDLALALLAASRRDLVADLEAAPPEALDWDPPYRRFASWATWRSVRAVLAHVANGETHYYTRSIGHVSPAAPAEPDGDWRVFLACSRAEAVAFLRAVRGSADLARVGPIDFGYGEEWWSLRKALRRLVSHEIGHAKSIRRILREFGARGADGRSHA